MGLTITQASDVNVLLSFILGRDATGSESPRFLGEREQEAMLRLTDGANRALGAGWRPEQIPAALGQFSVISVRRQVSSGS